MHAVSAGVTRIYVPLCQPLQQTWLHAGPISSGEESVPEKKSQRPNHAKNNVTPIVEQRGPTHFACTVVMHRVSLPLSLSLGALESNILKHIRDDVEL